jgi:hypothetical protein
VQLCGREALGWGKGIDLSALLTSVSVQANGRGRCVLEWSLLWDVAGRSHRYGSSVQVDESAAFPMSVVDLWAARTKGVWSPLTREGSKAVSKSWADGGGWGTTLSRASGCPA